MQISFNKVTFHNRNDYYDAVKALNNARIDFLHFDEELTIELLANVSIEIYAKNYHIEQR